MSTGPTRGTFGSLKRGPQYQQLDGPMKLAENTFQIGISLNGCGATARVVVAVVDGGVSAAKGRETPGTENGIMATVLVLVGVVFALGGVVGPGRFYYWVQRGIWMCCRMIVGLARIARGCMSIG